MAAGKEGGALPSSRGRDLLNIQLEVSYPFSVFCIFSMGKIEGKLVGALLKYYCTFQVTEKLLAAEEQKLRLLKSDIDEIRNGGDVTTSLSKVTSVRKQGVLMIQNLCCIIPTGQRAGGS